MSQVQQVSNTNRIISVLKTTLSLAKNHKKKTILLVVILSLYSLWKLKHKIPYQKIISKVMQKIMQAMDSQMKHSQFLEQSNIKLTLKIQDFDKANHIAEMQTKYSKLFKLEAYRNELRLKVKQLSSERKTELWQNIVDEVIVFVFFFIITTRQTVTLNMIQKTLVAKYKDDFNKIIGINQNSAQEFNLFDQILSEYCQTMIDHSISDTLKFLQQNLKSDIQATNILTFFELQKKLTEIFQNTVFSKKVQKQEYKARFHLTNSMDRPVEKVFLSPHDPTYQKPSIIARSIGLIKDLGSFVLPNMLPEEQQLNATKNRYEILSILFNTQQQESIAEMNSNKIISNLFKQYVKNNKSDAKKDLEDEEFEEIPDDIESSNQQQYSLKNSNNDSKVIDLRALNKSNLNAAIKQSNSNSDGISNQNIEQAKVFCFLVFKELRDILESSSLNNYFYFSSNFELRKFLNRLLLSLQKKNELNKAQSFGMISKLFDKIIVEEFLNQESDANNEGFYHVRMKRCFVLSKNAKSSANKQNQNNSDEASHSTDALSNPNRSEQDLISSGENQIINSSVDNLPRVTDPQENLINLNILQEIEQFHLVEDSLQEFIKRIFYERERTTVEIINHKNNNDPNQSQAGEGDINGLLSLLGGGNAGGSGITDFMTLLQKI
ncbi:hypothetical protein TTHERM_01054290 (macronuclear) [Tetrahymena thermophila SB210]|uniref:Uncharacterized protein n=1 Tax=Tetrahymena thermophila (strain SB210) TaxID=312017 RepID=Q22CC2_TETTS|nr:hypothetical protein TTHERM_01054290 [Tetrahymena thermophila SB210]EAR82944.1 hypothetical protein TTHERM_01054290 [Tetrahymena thermophila SB210]|eukprot:XP_001030607.1 hypothetical protein TTHERM_01054290 [Tetrahymena thermophila SB210]